MNNEDDFHAKMKDLIKDKKKPSIEKKSIIIKASVKELEQLIRASMNDINPHIDIKNIVFYVDNNTLDVGFLIDSYNIYPTITLYGYEDPYLNMENFIKYYIIKSEFKGIIKTTVKNINAKEDSIVEIVIK